MPPFFYLQKLSKMPKICAQNGCGMCLECTFLGYFLGKSWVKVGSKLGKTWVENDIHFATAIIYHIGKDDGAQRYSNILKRRVKLWLNLQVKA